MADDARRFFGVQFHPEVAHTPAGHADTQELLYAICGCTPSWTWRPLSNTPWRDQKPVGDRKVICALSGGVDSSVAAVLVHKAVGEQLTCIFVNNGVLRKDEAEQVQQTFTDMGLNLIYVDASAQFLGQARRASRTRRRSARSSAHTFIEVFERGGARRRAAPSSLRRARSTRT